MCRQRCLTEVCSLFALTTKEARSETNRPGFQIAAYALTLRGGKRQGANF